MILNYHNNYLNNFQYIENENEEIKSLCRSKNYFYKNDGLKFFDVNSNKLNEKISLLGNKNLKNLIFKEDVIFTMDCNHNGKWNILLLNIENIEEFTEKYIIYENNLYKFDKKNLNEDFGGIYYMKIPLNLLNEINKKYEWYYNIEKDSGNLWNYNLIINN